MTGTEATKYEIKDGAAWITLNRPENRNALSAVLVTELYNHLVQSNENDDVRCIILTGTDPAFCAGADLKNPPGSKIEGIKSIPYPEVLSYIVNSDKPVITAVNGAAFAGGLGLIGASDIVVTAEETICSFSEVRIGVIPANISIVCLPKLGTHHGMKLFLTGERFDGARAVEVGLAHRAVPRKNLYVAVQEEIDMINLGGPKAIVETKKLVRRKSKATLEEDFEECAEWSIRMFQSAEGAEGMAAFREKRKPSWIQ